MFWMGVNWKQVSTNKSSVGQVDNVMFPIYANRCRLVEYYKIYKNDIF